jgi:hypothetical protein
MSLFLLLVLVSVLILRLVLVLGSAVPHTVCFDNIDACLIQEELQSRQIGGFKYLPRCSGYVERTYLTQYLIQ